MLTCGNDYVSSSCGAGIRSVRSLGSAPLVVVFRRRTNSSEVQSHGSTEQQP